MRVGVDLLFIQPGRNRGTETYVQGLLRGLGVREGLELVLFTNQLNHSQFSEVRGVRRRRCSISGSNRLQRIVFQQTVLPRLAKAERCDLLFCPGYLAPVFSSIKTVVAIHDTQFIDVPGSIPAGQRLAYRAIVPLGARRAKAIITISSFSKGRIVEALKIKPERVAVTYLAPKSFDERGLSSMEERVFVEKHLLTRPYFLSVSNQNPHKNISGLIKAFVEFKATTGAEIDLVFAGSNLSAAERNSGISSRNDIRFLGYINDAELAVAYRRSRAFVLASFYEGFGLPIVEAMANGVPVACSNRASLPEVAGDAALLFDPGCNKSIGDAFGTLFLDRERVRQLVDAGYQNLNRFSWDKCATETYAVFSQAVGSRD